MSGTNLGKMPILIVSLVIGIVMATTAIVPLVSDYSDAKTFSNEGYFYMEKIDESSDISITWEYTSPNQISIGDDVVTLPTTVLTSIVCSGDGWIVRHSPGSYLQLYLPSGGVTASVSESTNLTITISSGTITATNDAATPVTKTASFTEGYCISADTDSGYVMKKSDSVAYMNSDSIIFGIGRTNVGTTNVAIEIEGTIEGVTITEVSSYSAVFGTPTIVSSEVSGYTDLYSLEKITFTGTVGEDTADITYSYFVVPSEVTADTDNPAAYKALVKVVPVMAFVALIAAAAFMIYSKRD